MCFCKDLSLTYTSCAAPAPSAVGLSLTAGGVVLSIGGIDITCAEAITPPFHPLSATVCLPGRSAQFLKCQRLGNKCAPLAVTPVPDSLAHSLLASNCPLSHAASVFLSHPKRTKKQTSRGPGFLSNSTPTARMQPSTASLVKTEHTLCLLLTLGWNYGTRYGSSTTQQ